MEKICNGCGCLPRLGDQWIHLKVVGVNVDTDSTLGKVKKMFLCPNCVTKIDNFIETLRDPTVKCPHCGSEEFHKSRKYFRNSTGGVSEGAVMYTCDWCSQSFTISEFVLL